MCHANPPNKGSQAQSQPATQPSAGSIVVDVVVVVVAQSQVVGGESVVVQSSGKDDSSRAQYVSVVSPSESPQKFGAIH